jgi:hypothetical protein
MPLAKIVSKVAKKAIKSTKVSANVTVKAPKGKRISSAEDARLKAINKTTSTTAKASKASAKALKASGKVKPKTDTMYTRFKSNSMETEKLTARQLAREAAAKRAASKMR